ncbi:MAG: Txe/YoeB family addiction module toxin [Kiritimatiellaeota bacterium]|nr:Txe/YoeB family addiction module toxin [Kiritimatiellota bacterium]
MPYKILLHRQALKDAKKIKRACLEQKVNELLDILSLNPWQNPPPYEQLSGDLKGYCSRRISIQHRLVYEVNNTTRVVKIFRMWSHYE